MAEAAGDVFALPTSSGPAEARRMGRAEAGQSRWRVAFPWGAETFFGHSDEVAAHARKRAEETAGMPGSEAHRSGRA